MTAHGTRASKIIKDAAVYISSTMVTQVISLIAGLITRRFLGPVQMGIWSLLQMLLTYSSYSALGVTEAISREIPFYLGKNDIKKAEEMKDVIFTFSLITSSLFSIGAVLYAVLNHRNLTNEFYYGLMITAVLIILQRLNNLHIAFLRGYKLFGIAGSQMIYSAVINIVLVSALTKFFKVYGFMIALGLSFIFNIGYIMSRHRFKFKWRMKWNKIIGLIQYGFPLIIISLLGVTASSIDKIMISKMLGLHELGVYSMALMIYLYIHQFPNSVGIVLIPNFHEKFGETEKADSLHNYMKVSSDVFSLVMPILIAACWFIAPFMLRKILPDFVDGLRPMNVLVVGSLFLALAHPYSYFIVAIRKQLLLIPLLISNMILAVLFNFITIKMGYGLIGVSFATSLVSFVNFTANYFIAYHFLKRDGWADYFKLIIRFLMMTSLLVGISFAFYREGIILTQLGCFILFSVFYIPLLIKLNKQLKLSAMLKKKFFPKAATEEEISELA